MVHTKQLKKELKQGKHEKIIQYLYGDKAPEQPERYIETIDSFEHFFGEKEVMVLSAPGRTEVCGNHTDHNNGKVLAASVNLDAVGVASPNDENIIRVKSKGYKMIVIDLNDLTIQQNEIGKSTSLIRGICARFKDLGLNVGGFDATTTSSVLPGSGLSSSAAFEVLIGTILNHLYNNADIDAVTIANISQWSENVYFGKPCGLLDQTACSVGGFVTIDFKDVKTPKIKSVDFDFASSGHALCIIDTGEDHADLTDEYAAVRREMEAVASVFNKDVLREVPEEKFLADIAIVRKEVGDRAILRAIHFYNDNQRVELQVKALEEKDFDTFKALVIDSGNSSYMYNQNVHANGETTNQAVALGLALSEVILKGKGAWRVHGGGFAGTIQAFVPLDILNEYQEKMQNVFGEDCFYRLMVRPVGGTKVI